jgi:hypothetical protein
MNPDDIDPDEVPLHDSETLYECADCGVRIIVPAEDRVPTVTCPALEQEIVCDWEELRSE